MWSSLEEECATVSEPHIRSRSCKLASLSGMSHVRKCKLASLSGVSLLRMYVGSFDGVSRIIVECRSFACFPNGSCLWQAKLLILPVTRKLSWLARIALQLAIHLRWLVSAHSQTATSFHAHVCLTTETCRLELSNIFL